MPPYIWMPLSVWMASCMFEYPHIFGHPLYVCMSSCLDTTHVWMPPFMFGHPLYVCMSSCLDTTHVWMPPFMFGHPLYVWMPPYVWMHPLYVWIPTCLDVWTLPCFDNAWMSPIHTQHKESMLCHTKGVSICPHTFGWAHYVWMPLMFGHPQYVWMPPFEHHAVCLGDLWMPPVHTQYIESMLCHTQGVSICPHTFGCPHMCRCTLYVWMPSYVWMAPCMFKCSHKFGHHP